MYHYQVQLRTQVIVTVRWRHGGDAASVARRVFAQRRAVLRTIGARTLCHYSDMYVADGYRCGQKWNWRVISTWISVVDWIKINSVIFGRNCFELRTKF